MYKSIQVTALSLVLIQTLIVLNGGKIEYSEVEDITLGWLISITENDQLQFERQIGECG